MTRMARLTVILALLCCFTAGAQRRIGIAFYDLDRLYDTIPALFYDDSDHTPTGKYMWDSERYRRKIINTTSVIDSMGMDIVALAGIETENIVRDIVSYSSLDYCYIHRTQNAFDGMDLALLYFGDRFCPDKIDTGRGYLYVEGMLNGTRIGIIVSNEAKYAEMLLTELQEMQPEIRYIVVGRFGAAKAERSGLQYTLSKAEAAGRGNVCYGNGWAMRDKIYADRSFTVLSGDVFIRRWMVDPKSGKPLQTFDKQHYIGGFSRYLPIFSYMK